MGRIHGQSKRNDQVIYESMILTGIWQLGKAWKSERLVVMNVDCIIHSIGSFIFKVAQGSKWVNSHTTLPGTILLLATKVPNHRKLLRPGKTSG